MHLPATASAKKQRATPGGQRVPVHPHEHRVERLSVSPDGKLFATSNWHGYVAVWHIATSLLVRTLQGCKGTNCHAWSPDGSQLATGCTSDNASCILVWDVATGAVKVALEGQPVAIVWSHDGLKICAGYISTAARVWEVATGDLLHVLEGHRILVNSAAWSPDGTCVATGSGSPNVRVWDAAIGVEVRDLAFAGTSRCDVYCISWSPVSGLLACAHYDHAVRVWNTVTCDIVHTLQGSAPARVVAWSPDGRQLASSYHD